MPEYTSQGTSMPLSTLPPAVAAYMQNAAYLQQIVAAMKEIPVLESEKPTDTNPLTKVEFPEEGGVLTYMGNHPYPYKGFPFFENVEKIDTIKKIFRGVLSGFYHSVKHRRLSLVLFLPLLIVSKDLLSTAIRAFHKLIERFRVKREMYSKIVREVYRTFDKPREGEDLKTLELRLMIKDTICTVLEFDNAYRYRFQDVIIELDKEAVKKNPRKELLRLLNLMGEREKTQEVRDTWRLLKMGVRFYLPFDRKISKMLGDVFSEVNLSELALTDPDKHFSCLRQDYTFKFMENPTSEDQKLIDSSLKRKKYNEESAILNSKLEDELAIKAKNQQQERDMLIPAELQKKVQEEVAVVQRSLIEQHAATPKGVVAKHFSEKQNNLLKKQEDEINDLLKQHEVRRVELATSYGL